MCCKLLFLAGLLQHLLLPTFSFSDVLNGVRIHKDFFYEFFLEQLELSPNFDIKHRIRRSESDNTLFYNTSLPPFSAPLVPAEGFTSHSLRGSESPSAHPHQHKPHARALHYDIAVMVGKNAADENRGAKSLESILQYVHGHRRIYVISPENYLNLSLFNTTATDEVVSSVSSSRSISSIKVSGARHVSWVPDEFIYSQLVEKFDFKDTYLPTNQYRNWVFQQIIKLHLALLLPDVLPSLLVIDGEVLIRRRMSFTTMVDGQVAGLYNIGRGPSDRVNSLYWNFVKDVVKGTARTVLSVSLIAHHMLVQRDILLDMIEYVESTRDFMFWRVLLNQNAMNEKRMSEYELYIRYSAFRFPDRTLLRLLPYYDVGNCTYTDGFVYYVSCHKHLTQLNISKDEQ